MVCNSHEGATFPCHTAAVKTTVPYVSRCIVRKVGEASDSFGVKERRPLAQGLPLF